MTKRELIEALEASALPDNSEICIKDCYGDMYYPSKFTVKLDEDAYCRLEDKRVGYDN